jgi:hypothetical protein
VILIPSKLEDLIHDKLPEPLSKQLTCSIKIQNDSMETLPGLLQKGVFYFNICLHNSLGLSQSSFQFDFYPSATMLVALECAIFK